MHNFWENYTVVEKNSKLTIVHKHYGKGHFERANETQSKLDPLLSEGTPVNQREGSDIFRRFRSFQKSASNLYMLMGCKVVSYEIWRF